MTISYVTVKRRVQIPSFDAEHWELYTNSMNCTKAANGLNAALKKACLAIAEHLNDEKNNTSQAQDMIFRHVWAGIMSPAMARYRDYGAEDTEPYVTAREALFGFIRQCGCYVTG